MTLQGLTWGQLALAGSIAFGAVGLLYLVRWRRERTLVSHLPLWRGAGHARERTDRWQRLRHWLSVLLQLLLAVLVLTAWAAPAPSPPRQPRSVLVLVDVSASLSAADPASPRWQELLTTLNNAFEGRADGDRFAIVAAGNIPRVLTGFSSSPETWRRALNGLHPLPVGLDLNAALELVQPMLAAEPQSVLWFLTDGGAPTVPIATSNLGTTEHPHYAHLVGRPATNLGFTALAARRYPLDPTRAELLAEVACYGNTAQPATLRVTGGGRLLERRTLNLRPGEVSRIIIADLPGGASHIEAALESGADPLPWDNRSVAALPPLLPLEVALIGERNRYLEAALAVDPNVRVTRWNGQGPSAAPHFDLLVSQGAPRPPALATLPTLVFAPPPSDSPSRLLPAAGELGFERWDRAHPLFAGISFGDVQIIGGASFVAGNGFKVLASSASGPLIVTTQRDGVTDISVSFDPRRSDWVLRSAWPLFVQRAVHLLADRNKDPVLGLRTGDPWFLPDHPAGSRLRRPSGSYRELAGGPARVVVEQEAGLYQLEVPGRPPQPLAANLHRSTESNLAAEAQPWAAWSDLPPTVATSPLPRWLRPFGRWRLAALAALLLIALLLFEWHSYHQRWTT